jgi:V/A-type H+-transporting ATPase subunit D
MARIRYTKNELKNQKQALQRYERYLPTLQLKKQQLLVRVQEVQDRLENKQAEEKKLNSELENWVNLFAEPIDLDQYIGVNEIRSRTTNIVGVFIPVLEEVSFTQKTPDLFSTPAWIDSGIEAIKELIRLEVEIDFLQRQYRLLWQELRTTNQRVNLFEKIKIPECKENIRMIQVFLGDQQTAAVVRSKLAKAKTAERSTSA